MLNINYYRVIKGHQTAAEGFLLYQIKLLKIAAKKNCIKKHISGIFKYNFEADYRIWRESCKLTIFHLLPTISCCDKGSIWTIFLFIPLRKTKLQGNARNLIGEASTIAASTKLKVSVKGESVKVLSANTKPQLYIVPK